MTQGTLYGVGVGPGDPELMTVKAWRLVSTARVIAYLSANGGESTARDIARTFFPDDATELAIDMPMRIEREHGEKAYDAGAAQIAAHLEAGRDVVMLCEGDPFFYGSFMYLFARLAGKFETVVVPGVSSITASAAAIGRPLAARNEVLKVLPATLAEDRLREELQACESATIIKVGRHLPKLRNILGLLDLTSKSVVIEKATRDEEKITPLADVEGDVLPYFTTILVYTGREPW
ncbi:precorrin-2 C(20)-methyltransferase [Aestuariivirga sp.]|uniref:precorrin-2 C(20)-methyltransferase n=1 Tax=Aestuariivirga sp. TaxID=2650926 RepID=UPI0039E3C223